MPTQGFKQEKYFNDIIYKQKKEQLCREMDNFRSTFSFNRRVFSSLWQKLRVLMPSDLRIKRLFLELTQ